MPAQATWAPWPRRSALLLMLLAPNSGCSDLSAPEADELTQPPEPELNLMEELGRSIFEDRDLSIGKNQSCATCHDAAWGFKGSSAPSQGGVFQGSIPGRFGNRVPLSAAYAAFAPVLQLSETAGGYVGGNFWDGRATGAELGSPAAEQARGPFLNPAEQGLPDMACVVLRVSRSNYAARYREAWGMSIDRIAFPTGADALCGMEGTTLQLSPTDREHVRVEYDRIARSVAAFEGSAQVSAFSSKFDAWLKGTAQLTQQEHMGMMLFQGRARCSNCHTIAGPRPLFTDFSYHNVGTPPNPDSPALARDPGFIDLGLGGANGAAPGASRWGLVRTPTLRNVDKRPSAISIKPFMHNGAFLTLKEVVRYYNTRDVLPACAPAAPRSSWGTTCWPASIVRDNLNVADMGDLRLNSFQEDAVVAFLRTLTDGYVP